MRGVLHILSYGYYKVAYSYISVSNTTKFYSVYECFALVKLSIKCEYIVLTKEFSHFISAVDNYIKAFKTLLRYKSLKGTDNVKK